MKEEEGEGEGEVVAVTLSSSSSSSRSYLSPVVRQDLAKLEKGGESRRIAMTMLKQFVEHLDPGSVPRFLAQVSESKDLGGSRTYAISLYEEVARVHGKLIIPQIPRMMATVTRSLSASGSSPQLHQACAKVVSALARYAIDPETSTAQADEILRDISKPLIEAIAAGRLEPVSAGAAICLQALVESEKWKHAPPELISDLCHQTTTALGEKSTQTVAHMQLARSLASINPRPLSVYGPALLRAGEEVLSNADLSWQHRKCAAKMLQAVISILDSDRLGLELRSTKQVLANCQQDKMPHVRTAVCEVLKLLQGAEECSRDTDHSEVCLNESPKITNALQERPYRQRSDSSTLLPTTGILTHEPPHVSLLPSSKPTISEGCSQVSSRSPPGTGAQYRMGRSSSSGDTHMRGIVPNSSVVAGTFDECHSLASHHVKEYLPSQISGVEDLSRLPGAGDVWTSKYAHPRARTLGSSIPLPPSLMHKSLSDYATLEEYEKDMSKGKNSTPTMSVSKDRVIGRVASCLSPLEASIISRFADAEGDLMAEDDGFLSEVGALPDLEMEEGSSFRNDRISKGSLEPNFTMLQSRVGTETPQSILHSQNALSVSGSNHSTTSNRLCEIALKNNDCSISGGVSSMNRMLLVNSSNNSNSSLMEEAIGGPQVGTSKPGVSHTGYLELANLSRNTEDGLSIFEPRLHIATEDFQPFTTPRRLVHSLQSDLSSPHLEGSISDQDDESVTNEGEFADLAGLTGEADMDLDSSSEKDWSMHENSLHADQSLQAEDSIELELDETPRGGVEAVAFCERAHLVDDSSQKAPICQKSLDSCLDQLTTPVSDYQSSQKGYIGTYTHTPDLPQTTSRESEVLEFACSSGMKVQSQSTSFGQEQGGMGIIKNSEDGKPGSPMTVMRSLPFEKASGRAREVYCCSQESEPLAMGSVSKSDKGTQEGTSALREINEHSLVHDSLKLSWFVEIVLGGSVCLILALALAMTLMPVFDTDPDNSLLPT